MARVTKPRRAREAQAVPHRRGPGRAAQGDRRAGLRVPARPRHTAGPDRYRRQGVGPGRNPVRPRRRAAERRVPLAELAARPAQGRPGAPRADRPQERVRHRPLHQGRARHPQSTSGWLWLGTRGRGVSHFTDSGIRNMLARRGERPACSTSTRTGSGTRWPITGSAAGGNVDDLMAIAGWKTYDMPLSTRRAGTSRGPPWRIAGWAPATGSRHMPGCLPATGSDLRAIMRTGVYRRVSACILWTQYLGFTSFGPPPCSVNPRYYFGVMYRALQ